MLIIINHLRSFFVYVLLILTVPLLTGCKPIVLITGPDDGQVFDKEAEVYFSCFAYTLDSKRKVADESILWVSSLEGLIGTGSAFQRDDLSEGEHIISVMITSASGNKSFDSITIRIGNQAPSAVVTLPAGGSAFALGESITFTGEGRDPEDGLMVGSSLSWSSDQDGPLGKGNSITVATLTETNHRIRLTATDSAGAQGFDEILVTVGNPPLPPPTTTSAPVTTTSTTVSGDSTTSIPTLISSTTSSVADSNTDTIASDPPSNPDSSSETVDSDPPSNPDSPSETVDSDPPSNPDSQSRTVIHRFFLP